jgi:heptosyltransferase-2
MANAPLIPADRIVVVMPNWLGDGVMATPFLRVLRGLYPGAHIAAVARQLVAPVLEGSGLVEEIRTARRGEDSAIAKWMRQQQFQLGVLLPNSFRSAWMLWRGGVARRLGYARGGRGFLLTDRLPAERRSAGQRAADRRREQAIRDLRRRGAVPGGGKMARGGGAPGVGSAYQPVPTIEYYLALGGYLAGGGAERGPMELSLTAREREEAGRALENMGIGGGARYAVLVPGANFGSSKCWLPERFAEVADRLLEGGVAGDDGAMRGRAQGEGPLDAVVLAGSPTEAPLLEAILAGVGHKGRVVSLAHLNGGKGISVGGLKQVVRGAAVMICNDTGPRHFAAAFDVPAVTLFGPTDPVWAETFALRERIVRIDVPCGPCQLKKCPIDHRCMRGITVEQVMAAVREVMPAGDFAGGRRAACVAPVAGEGGGEGGAGGGGSGGAGT